MLNRTMCVFSVLNPHQRLGQWLYDDLLREGHVQCFIKTPLHRDPSVCMLNVTELTSLPFYAPYIGSLLLLLNQT